MSFRYWAPKFKTDYLWSNDCSSLEPGSYMTRLGTSKVKTVRYFDGKLWWYPAIKQRKASLTKDKTFKLPSKNRSLYNEWMRKASTEGHLYLRSITNQSTIQWGTPYKIFSEAEVIKHLVNTGRLRSDWRSAYQAEMQGGLPPGPDDTSPIDTAISNLGDVVSLLKVMKAKDADKTTSP